MKKMKLGVVALALAFGVGGAVASPIKKGDEAMSLFSADTNAQIKKMRNAKIKAQRALPISGISLVEIEGATFYVSQDGRFAFIGQMIDLYSNEAIMTAEDVDNYIDKIQLDRLGIKPADISTFVIGTGSKRITIFIDPRCPHCHTVLGQIDEELKKQYTFYIAIVPVLGGSSTEFSKKLDCAPNKEVAFSALMQRNEGFVAAVPQGCNPEKVQRAVIAGTVLDLQGVPFIVRDDGKVKKGATRNLKAWLEGRPE